MTSDTAKFSLVLAAAFVALTGCKVGPDYHAPDVLVPEGYAATTRPATAPATQPAADLSLWWDRLGDPQLSALIQRATEGNLDLKLAKARLREVRAARGIAASRGQLQVDGGAGYLRQQNSKTVSDSSSLGPRETDFWRAGFDAAWELDVFGGDKRAVEAADADVAASVENVRDVLVSLQAEVARNYVDLRSAQARLQVAKENLNTQQELKSISVAKFEAGLATDVDVARIEAQMATTASQIPVLEAAAADAIYQLSVLLGKGPGELLAELRSDRPIPVAPPTIAAGQPGELLKRRPDVRRAEQQLRAATARIGEAKAELYPKFSLIGSLGLESSKFTNWWNADSSFWSIGPSVSWSLLNGGRVNANIEVQNARTEQALLIYQSTILSSVKEVDSAATRYGQEQRRRESLLAAVNSSQRAVRLSQELYEKGLSDFLNVLDAQRSLLLNQDLLVQSEQAATSDAIAVYKALGGGWQ